MFACLLNILAEANISSCCRCRLFYCISVCLWQCYYTGASHLLKSI